MTCGIYCIKNIKNGKIYIGSSINCENRFKQHQKELRNNYHGNDHLQKAIKKYGINNFNFSIIEICLENNLIEAEDNWINKFNSMDSKNGYNKKSADRTIITEEAKQNHLIACNTPEYKAFSSKNSKENIWGKKIIRDKLLKNQSASMHTKTYSKKISDSNNKRWANSLNEKTRYSELFKEKFNNHESPTRNKAFAAHRISKKNKELGKNTLTAIWSDQIRKEKMLMAQKNGRTEKTIEKISNNSKKMWARPGFQKARSAERILKWADPKFKEKMKEIKKANLLIPIKCKICEKLFVRNVHNQTMCSKECKDKNKKQNYKYLNSVRAS